MGLEIGQFCEGPGDYEDPTSGLEEETGFHPKQLDSP